MKRVQVQLPPDCHTLLKCACAQMGVTMSEFYNNAGREYLNKLMHEDEHLKQLMCSIPLTPDSQAYNLVEQHKQSNLD